MKAWYFDAYAGLCEKLLHLRFIQMGGNEQSLLLTILPQNFLDMINARVRSWCHRSFRKGATLKQLLHLNAVNFASRDMAKENGKKTQPNQNQSQSSNESDVFQKFHSSNFCTDSLRPSAREENRRGAYSGVGVWPTNAPLREYGTGGKDFETRILGTRHWRLHSTNFNYVSSCRATSPGARGAKTESVTGRGNNQNPKRLFGSIGGREV